MVVFLVAAVCLGCAGGDATVAVGLEPGAVEVHAPLVTDAPLVVEVLQVDVTAELGPLHVELGQDAVADAPPPAAAPGPAKQAADAEPRRPDLVPQDVQASVGFGVLLMLMQAWNALSIPSRWTLAGRWLASRLAEAGWLVGAWGGFSRIEGQAALEHPARHAIARLVEEEPGIHIEEVRRRLDVSTNTAIHHIRVLSRNRLLVVHRHGNQRLLYPPTGEATRARAPLATLGSPPARRIAGFVAAHPGTDQKGLCQAVRLGAPAASRHLKNLADEGLVRVVPDGRRRRYHPTKRLAYLLALTEAGTIRHGRRASTRVAEAVGC